MAAISRSRTIRPGGIIESLAGISAMQVRHQYGRRKVIEFKPDFDAALQSKEHRINVLRYKRNEKKAMRVLEEYVPDSFKKYDSSLDSYTTLTSHLEALSEAGHRRPYRVYNPASDLDVRFFDVVKQHIDISKYQPSSQKGENVSVNTINMSSVKLANCSTSKARLLSALASELDGHLVPNSMLHLMVTLEDVFRFYATPVTRKNTYDEMFSQQQRGELPPNLHVQLHHHRFDPNSENPSKFDRTAFPGSSTIIVEPENRLRFKDVIADRPPYIQRYEEIGDA